ncbi:cupin domain-containing protein [Burkholderia guangdongensis]|uniref:cupin domain-containing protein n=1 Tax=Burkholderia guangdongensis TaxID=1792500 RepID=UPI0015C69FB4|nr:cupin domain-containing protein [Burkholderia guangdongensis]
MHSIKAGAALPQLDSWGTVADLGSTITEGEAKASGHVHFGTPTSPVSAGYFACTKGKFEMVYPFSEHATVVEGECTLLNRTTGEAVHYKAGDGWFIEKGTPIAWDIQSERFVKHYMAVA